MSSAGLTADERLSLALEQGDWAWMQEAIQEGALMRHEQKAPLMLWICEGVFVSRSAVSDPRTPIYTTSQRHIHHVHRRDPEGAQRREQLAWLVAQGMDAYQGSAHYAMPWVRYFEKRCDALVQCPEEAALEPHLLSAVWVHGHEGNARVWGAACERLRRQQGAGSFGPLFAWWLSQGMAPNEAIVSYSSQHAHVEAPLLTHAIEGLDVATAMHLLEAGARPTTDERLGRTLFHTLALRWQWHGNPSREAYALSDLTALPQRLHERGVRADARDAGGQTARERLATAPPSVYVQHLAHQWEAMEAAEALDEHLATATVADPTQRRRM